MPHRLTPIAALCLLLTAGCTTVGASADRAAASRELTAVQLRAAVLSDADLGAGYTVTVMKPPPGAVAADTGRETADVPACQPVLDAVGQTNPAAGPLAETDLSVSSAAAPDAGVYAGLLAFQPGRAAQVQEGLEKVLAQCTAFTSVSTGGKGVSAAHKGVRTKHRLARLDTPTPEGADGATAFTLTNESATGVLLQRALLTRTGTALAVFSTVGSGQEQAPAPDDRIVRAQVAKLRTAQA
ncbi:hypothetical protein GCM10009760_03520 [Kitasatospora kazusensis]|uniref:PknH-like protein n=1 Tax=Kitasatospora kazusensis TaxID=407974 RepID=A0ABP5KDP1_9ACTN